jgi:PPM family protein phosphatase
MMTHSNAVTTDGLDTVASTHDPGTFNPRYKVRADFGALSHVGKVRKNNEDHFLIARLGRAMEPVLSNLPPSVLPSQVEEHGYGLLVADGMGGAAAGEVASRMAVRLLLDLVLEAGKWGRRIDKQEARELVRRVEKYFGEIHSALISEAEANPDLAGMGTTLTVAYSFCAELVIAHVGDSRAYLFRRGELHQLTRDHTLAQALVDKGQLTRQEAARHHFRHILTNALGGKSGPAVADIQLCRLENQDRLLLCSDGLTDMVDDATISRVLASAPDARSGCSSLVELALEAGGKDNVTMVLAHYNINT